MKNLILLVEDNTELATTVVDFFEKKGALVDYAPTAKLALNLLNQNKYDIVILDLMLPGMSGLELCQVIRREHDVTLPILMLTALDSVDDIVYGFNCGADDYLTKPFVLPELEVRVAALARRNGLKRDVKITIGPITFDRRTHQVFRDGVEIKLSKMGFQIMRIIVEEYPRVVSKSELIQKLWGDSLTESDVLRSHLYQLRLALDKPFTTPLLKTVHGVGVTFQNID
ncbi:response regulator transcription factor [Planctobacterium marinum]|uniref:response regulator transcription factor n=1 Tax=Planctobacterium marinum TaxID=1631968 RepID=UPI001E51B0A8|nr:response regulator transcription factor [Planctobacterium marinum]